MNSKKILILEDEPSIAETLVYAISKEGFEPIVCSTIREAITKIENEFITLSLFDIGLPDGSGLELLKNIRKESALPIILLTARNDEVDRVLGLEFGADDYISKPFSPREVVARIKTVLRRTEPKANENVKSVKNFNIDEHRQIIFYHDKPLQLSRYEYRMLAALIHRPGWVFEREKLMNICWDVPESSMERTVDTHIKTLRSKLKEILPEYDPIITHRGVGYSLREES